MPAPRHIIDTLECVVSVFFSNVRHNLRAAFILCDELVEITCRERARQTHRTLGRIDFFQLLKLPAVGLDPGTTALGRALFDSHNTRNDMHHANAAATVDPQHCADAILDAVDAIEHCFAGSLAMFPDPLRVAIRVTKVFSARGSHLHRAAFTQLMRQHAWRGTITRVKKYEMAILPGEKENWGFVLPREYDVIDAILTAIGAP